MPSKHLPPTMTPENLAVWIKDNSLTEIMHTDVHDYTEEEIEKFEHNATKYGISIKKLEQQKKDINDLIKKGTGKIDITLEETEGIDSLKKKRDALLDNVDRGFREDVTTLYQIPVPEEEQMMFFDIEGNVYEEHTKDMTSKEKEQYVGLFRQDLQSKESDVDEETDQPDQPVIEEAVVEEEEGISDEEAIDGDNQTDEPDPGPDEEPIGKEEESVAKESDPEELQTGDPNAVPADVPEAEVQKEEDYGEDPHTPY